jgi:hypothetical protein
MNEPDEPAKVEKQKTQNRLRQAAFRSRKRVRRRFLVDFLRPRATNARGAHRYRKFITELRGLEEYLKIAPRNRFRIGLRTTSDDENEVDVDDEQEAENADVSINNTLRILISSFHMFISVMYEIPNKS